MEEWPHGVDKDVDTRLGMGKDEDTQGAGVREGRQSRGKEYSSCREVMATKALRLLYASGMLTTGSSLL